MDSRDKGKSITPTTNLTIRPGRPQTTESNTTQTTRSSSNTESGLFSNSHDHTIAGQPSSPTTGTHTQITGVLNSSIPTTDATPPGGPRRSSDSSSIELKDDPEHPHARDVEKHVQKLAKSLDRNDEKSKKG